MYKNPKNKTFKLATFPSGQLIDHTYYTLSYNEAHEQAEWVAYELTPGRVYGQLPRHNNFRTDEAVPTGSATPEDYRASGYDRGHLVPAGDMKFDARAMDETFFLSNISPQKKEFNSGIWNELEKLVRKWAIEYEHLYVICGPVLSNPLERIGPNGVSVPSHYYKILFDDRAPETKMIAFLIPHQASDEALINFVVPVDEVEQLTGIDFFPGFDQRLTDSLEANSRVDLWFGRTTTSPAPADLREVQASEAEQYFNQKCRVCGRVVDTHRNASITHLNFEAPYPHQPFSAVIFHAYRKNFDYQPEVLLKGKQVCVQGKIQLHKGKAQIVLRSPEQILLR